LGMQQLIFVLLGYNLNVLAGYNSCTKRIKFGRK